MMRERTTNTGLDPLSLFTPQDSVPQGQRGQGHDAKVYELLAKLFFVFLLIPEAGVYWRGAFP